MPPSPVTGDGQVYTVIKWSEKGRVLSKRKHPKILLK